MKRSVRKTFGILTLLALTFSFGETVWASVCPPMPEADAPMVEAMETLSEDSGDGAQAHGCRFTAHQDTEDDGRCPLTPAATQGCGAAVSLPAVEARFTLPGIIPGTDVATEPTTRPLLLARSLYHPPRA